VQGEYVYLHGLGDRAQIDPAAAEAFVADHLAALGAWSKYPGLRYSVHSTTETVVVRVTAPLDLPITPPGWESSSVITGTAAAYVAVGEE
jgi:hypothetical protein